MTEYTPSVSISMLDERGSIVKTWPLSGKKNYRIGRAKSNDIILSNSWTSRQHAMLQREENGSFNAIDLGSSNGTSVNGHRIHTPTKLRSGDLIQIGNKTILTFLQEDEEHPKRSGLEDLDEKTVAFLEKEQVTILICDIRNFTSLSEEIGDQKISDILKLWTGKINETVHHYHGSVDKFIGDAVMAIWIGKASPQQNLHLALTCALKISELTLAIGEQLSVAQPLKVGAALNMGEAVVGNMGVDGNRDYTAIGDVVNVAFRLDEVTTKIGKDVLIGNEAALQLDNLVPEIFEPCKYLVKGKREPVTAYGCNFEQLKEYLARRL